MASLWLRNKSITFDDATPAKTVEGKGAIDLAANGYVVVAIQFTIAFGGSADGDAEIRIRSSSDDGVSKDTILLSALTAPFATSTTKRVTVVVEKVPYIEVGVYNGNSAAEDITISAKYAALHELT